MKKPSSIDEYIAAFPPDVRAILEGIRRTVRQAAPEAEEAISYGMPSFKGRGTLVYFAAWKNPIGLYPPVSVDAKLEKAVAPFAEPRGNLQFPLDRPIPHRLIERIVRHRVKQDRAKGASTR